MALAEAFKTRWAAAGLATSVGVIWNGRVPECKAVPNVTRHAVYNEISNTEVAQTRCVKILRAEIQVDIYSNDGDSGALHSKAQSVVDAIEYSDKAASNPFTMSGYAITDIVAIGEPVTTTEGDEEVCRSRVGFIVRYSKVVDRTP